MERGNRRLQYLITIAVSTATATAGAAFAWPTTVLPKFYNNETGFYLTEAAISWVVSMTSLGYMFGSLCSRTVSDRYGRRATFLGSVVPIGTGAIRENENRSVASLLFPNVWVATLIFFEFAAMFRVYFHLTDSITIVQLFARDGWSLCTAKFLWGIGMGFIGSVSSIYLAEVSDSDIRGRLILGNRSLFSFGGLLVMVIGPFVSYQTINYSFMVLPICYFIACWFIPETPYFLLKQGKVDAARDTLVKLTAIKNEEVLEERLSQMRSHVKKEMIRSGSIKEFLTGKQYKKAIFIVVGIKVTQLMAGLHAIQQYLGPIIQESNSGMRISTALIIFGVVRFTVGIMSSQLVDRLGRRPLMIYSFFASGVCLVIIGACFFTSAHPSSSNTHSYYSYIPYVGIILALLSSVLGFESVAYMIPAEIFPINIKTVAMTAGNIFAGTVNFMAMKSYQSIKDLGGLSAVFWVFATSSLAGAVFSFFFVPETKNKSLREIQIELQGDLYDDHEQFQPQIMNSDKGASEENELESLKRKDEV